MGQTLAQKTARGQPPEKRPGKAQREAIKLPPDEQRAKVDARAKTAEV
ncbi:hypothetical protein [Streptomyces sp. NPDC056061]